MKTAQTIASWTRAIAATALIAGCGGPQSTQGAVTDQQAQDVALQHVPGASVVRVEHEGQSPNAVIEVVVRRQDGTLAAVEVDGQSGAFLSVEAEDDDDDRDGEVDEHEGHADQDGEVDEHEGHADQDGEVDEHEGHADQDGEVDEHEGQADQDGEVDEHEGHADQDGEVDEHPAQPHS